MLGLTEKTNDFREIEQLVADGNEQATLALEIFCHRLRKYIGAYSAILGGLDVLIFTAGIGERSPMVRAMTTRNMEYLGVVVDEAKNKTNAFDIGIGRVKVLVVPTNEELAIARDTKLVLQQHR